MENFHGTKATSGAAIDQSDFLVTSASASTVINSAATRQAADQVEASPEPINAGRALHSLTLRAKKLYDERRQIDRVFGLEGFSLSPSWDIILQLYSEDEGRLPKLAASALTSSHCPPSTCMRWLKVLEQMELIESVAPDQDSDIGFFRLTKEGKMRTEAVLLGANY
jgi:hypothetical protein